MQNQYTYINYGSNCLISLLCCWLVVAAKPSAAQSTATIKETTRTFQTYPFSDPDPVPQPGRIYPYFRYDGFTNQPITKAWKVIELENDYIKVFITPEIGGKIWGAVEKSTNFPFVYFNNVVKFRDVAMRGPWTSCGIEINFGDIGHDPTVSHPVDYFTRANADGSVSCFLGAWDWASRTRWTVEVNLPKDKACFTTKSRWFNASPLDQTYYHWMNAGFRAAGNLEFVFPGTNHVGHAGEIGKWPVDSAGRAIRFYEKNNFGSYKSYHVTGTATDFFGGYWHQNKVGFVRYSPYHEKLGKKVWVWGLSRQGMIWENLLTDTDGQYVELQSGRLFTQAADASINSPFKHVAFQPGASDTFTEYWYPVKNTGGITHAYEWGALNLRRNGDWVVWSVSPSQNLSDTLQINSTASPAESLIRKPLTLKPLEVYQDSVKTTQNVAISLGGSTLAELKSNDTGTYTASKTDRPLTAPTDFDWNSEYGLYLKGKDLANQRKYTEAEEWLLKCLQKNKYHVLALGELAQLYYRRAMYDKAFELTSKALSINTYDPLANYIRGLSARNQGNAVAKDGFSVAALSPTFRAASLVELAKIALLEKEYNKAEKIVSQALEHQSTNDHARHLQLMLLRNTNHHAEALKRAKLLLEENPLDHIARFEENLLTNKKDFSQFISNELRHEDFIEMAIWYQSIGQFSDALTLLEVAPNHPMVLMWRGVSRGGANWPLKMTNQFAKNEVISALTATTDFVLPFRAEEFGMIMSLPFFAASIDKPIAMPLYWKVWYYYALLTETVSMNRKEAKAILSACGNEPDWAPFYLFKANLYHDQKDSVRVALERAHELASTDWRVKKELAEFHSSNGNTAKALEITESMLKSAAVPIHVQYILGQLKAKYLYDLGRFQECVDFMKTLNILPNEGAASAHALYRNANIRHAMALVKQNKNKDALPFLTQAESWPEHLGSGAPYDPDNRLTTYLKSVIEQRNSKKKAFAAPKPQLSKGDQALLAYFEQ